jgi:hypothetical protein
MAKSNVDSIELGSSRGTGYIEFKAIKVKITAAQILALNATPIEIVPAAGAGTVIEFESAVFHKIAGTAYAGIAAGEDIAIKYTNGSGAQVNTSLETTGFMDQTTAQTRITRAIATEYTPVANAALVLQILTGEITTGDSPLYITVSYKVHKNVTSDLSGIAS